MAHTYQTLQNAVLEAFADNSKLARMTIVSACGTGKTRQSLAIRELSGSQLTVVFEPTLSLISQNLTEWQTYAKEPFEALVVCSDGSVTDDEEILVSLDNRDIRDWLATPGDLPKVLFTTYQSSHRLADIYKEYPNTPAFTLGLFDEAHMAAVNNQDSLFATSLRDDIKIDQRVFFTATPKVFDEDGSTNSMDNEAIFGKTIFSYTNKQAVADGLIKDFEIVIATVTNKQVGELIEGHKIVGAEMGNVSAQSAATQIAVSKAIKEFNLNRMIGFFSTVTGAKQAAADFNVMKHDLGVEHMVSSSVDGSMPAGEVSAEIEELKLGNRVLHSCKCIGVGTNVPAVDGLVFSDPKSSLIEIIQNIGRGQRKTHAGDNTPLIVVLPLVVADKLVVGGFNKLIKILNAIREQDDLVAISKGQRAAVNPIQGRGMGVLRFMHCDTTLDDEFINGIELSVGRGRGAPFDPVVFAARCQEYEDFIAANGAYPSASSNASQQEQTLADWAYRMRMYNEAKVLSDERRAIMDRIIPDFIWPVYNRGEACLAFEQRFALLGRYVRENGALPGIEHPLTQWFRTTKASVEKDQWDKLKETYPGYFESFQVIRDTSNGLTDNLRDQFLAKMAQIQSFYQTHGTLPGSAHDATLNIYQYRLLKEFAAGKQLERKVWLEQNFPEFFTAKRGINNKRVA